MTDKVLNIGINSSTIFDCFFNRCKLIIKQYQVSRILGYFSSCDSHGNSNIGCSQSRRIINTISCHAHNFPMLLKLLNNPLLVLRGNTRIDIRCFNDIIELFICHFFNFDTFDDFSLFGFYNAKIISNSTSCIFVITCNHNDFDTCLLQCFNRSFDFFTRRVNNSCNPRQDNIFF